MMKLKRNRNIYKDSLGKRDYKENLAIAGGIADVKDKGQECKDWFHLARDTNGWRTLLNLRTEQNARIFLD
jgi:hypothetical protein